MANNSAPDGDHSPMDEKTPFNQEEDTEFTHEQLDDSKVKFVNGGAKADVQIKIPSDKEKKENDFCGLTKEELLEFADDPFWVRTRWILLIAFWVAWIGMLVVAIIIIFITPKCPPRPKMDWWQKSVAYQIYPRSFKDSNGDGHGDLNGIHSKLDDIKKLNVTTIWLNPIYPSTDLDWGYDITDFTAVHPDFGTMEDFESLMAAIHKQGLRLIMDFVPNHTSRNHTWFQESRKGTDNDYADYYVWVEGTEGTPPNNWQSVFGGPAWTWDPERGAYYYHQFLPEMPDLNMRSAGVRQKLEEALTFWLDKKVDGFRIDAAPHLFEAENMADEPNNPDASGSGYESLVHNQTKYLPDSYDLVTQWRKLLDDYSKEEGLKHPRLLIVEATGDIEQSMGFYEHNGKKGAHMPLNFQLMDMDSSCNARCMHDKIAEWRDAVPSGKWTNWRTGNHDHARVASDSRMTRNAVNAINMLTMTLPGTQVTYYGEELGMVNVPVSFEDTKDTFAKRLGETDYATVSRDPQRTPMQWNTMRNAGFSTANHTWLPVASDYIDWNVQTQNAHGSGIRNIEVYNDLTTLRSEPSMSWGEMIDLIHDDNMLVYLRNAEGFDTFLVAINLGDENVTVNLRSDTTLVPPEGYIVASTKNFGSERAEAFKAGVHVPLESVKLHPYEGIVVGWPYTAPQTAAEA